MQWRHTPPLELGFSHGKMFPEFRSQAQSQLTRKRCTTGLGNSGSQSRQGTNEEINANHDIPHQSSVSISMAFEKDHIQADYKMSFHSTGTSEANYENKNGIQPS
ncbi:hypothetical protein MHYP_G00058810 [Metynnis hypsauchen]